MLLTTQYLEEADQLADRIAVVSGGRVVANDTADALKAQLGSTTIEITMPDEKDAISAHEVLSRKFVDITERDGDTVRLITAEGPLILVDVLGALKSDGLAPGNLSVREPTLDDVFLRLTGESCALNEPEAEEVPCD